MTFSVIVPTYNRLPLLRRAVESLVRQTLTDSEIIVVNDGSTDGTDEYLTSMATTGTIKYLKQHNLGPAAARNAGLRQASGSYIAYTDDDCVVPAHWLRRFHDVFENSKVDILGGVVRNCVADDMYAGISQEITNHFVQVLGAGGGSTPFLTSNNIAYRRETLKKAGGFDERFRLAGGEERALNLRILNGGGSSALIADLVVDHYHTLRLAGFFRQQFNYGRGAFLLYRVMGRELNVGPRIIPASAYASLVKSFFRDGTLAGFAKTSLFLVGQGVVVLGFVFESITFPRTARTHNTQGNEGCAGNVGQ